MLHDPLHFVSSAARAGADVSGARSTPKGATGKKSRGVSHFVARVDHGLMGELTRFPSPLHSLFF
jgi:hypothetical protein